MLSQIPMNLSKVEKGDVDKEILRAAIIAELDAISLYEQMAHTAQEDKIKALLMDIAREEKTHVGEFHALLLKMDREQEKELANGRDEVDELLEG